MHEASAIYEPMLSAGWIGDIPPDRDLVHDAGAPVPGHWTDVVVRRRLQCGIELTVQRRGFAIYVDWVPGMVRPPGTPGILTYAELSMTAKPALIQRLRVINSHLTLIHAASMSCDDTSPPVMRVNYRDLYAFDYPDEGGPGYWYRYMVGTLGDVVTRIERRRIGNTPIATFDLSCDWLDTVIRMDALIEFDLLNQTQVAAASHDYALAVIAGWTICEIGLRRLSQSVLGRRKGKG
jgi:hypothetical protein